MKNRKNKKKILIIAIILICSMLSAYLSACKKDDSDNNNNNSNNNAGIGNIADDGGNNNAGNAGADANNFDAVYTSKEIADAIIAAYKPEDIPEETYFDYFLSGAEVDSENYLDPEKAGRMINGNISPVKEFDYLEDYAFYAPIGNHVFEIDVLKIKEGEEQNIDAVKDILEKRLKRKDNGDIRNYVEHEVPLLDNAKIITAGRYVILLATTDNSKAESVINNMIKSGNNSGLSNTPSVTDSNNNNNNIENPAEEQVQLETNKPVSVSVDEVVNIEPEILFDIEQFKTLVGQPAENQTEQPDNSDNSNNNVRRTAVPSVTVNMYSHNTSFLIGGKCEVGAMIRVTGGTEEIYTGSDYGDYLVEAPFGAEGVSTLKITAELDGKLPSEEITFIVKPQKNITLFEDGGLYGNVIGYNYQYFCADSLDSYVGDDLINDNEKKSLQTRTEKKIQDLRAKGCNAEIIYLLIPNPMRIYAENAPSRYIQNTGETLRMQWGSAVTAGGATVIDLTDLFMEHKNDEFKLFQKTDTHWTEYGALFGYNALMNYIGQKFPDALPRPSSDFEVYKKEYNCGDIYSRFDLDQSKLKETTSLVKFNFDPPGKRLDLYENGNCLNLVHAKVSMSQTTNTNLKGLKLPKAYFFRDSFEGTLHDFITDRFDTATFNGMWDYNFNINKVTAANPDYIIYVISERNIKNVLYN